MNRIRLSLLSILLVTAATQAGGWTTDHEAALRKARQGNKAILMNFTGSDWCGWCVKLKDEIFNQPEFKSYANANLILVEIDFPRRKPLSSEQKAANQKLAARYGIRGFPTLVLLDSRGEEIGRTGYMRGGPGPFVERLKQVTGKNNPPRGSASAFVPAPSPQAVETEPKPGLNLDGVSGRKGRRFAIINNETFTKGQVGKIKLDGSTVQIKCIEIQKDTAMVQLENEAKPRQISLRRKK